MNVVFSEGKNDVYFLKNIHTRVESVENYDIYLAEEADVGQTKWLRHQYAGDQFEYLYKSEEGVSNLIKQFRSHSLMFTEFSLYILVDLDGGPLGEFLGDLNGKLTESYGNKVNVVKNSHTSNSDMYIVDATLEIRGGSNRNLPIMAFYEDLEEVTGINKGEDRKVKAQKISKYIDNNTGIVKDICSIIHQ